MSKEAPNIYLIRHGATEWSVTGQHTGRTDIALTPKGEQEALALKPRVQHLQFSKVYSSPLQRARKTAELLGLPNIEIEPNLAEWHYGKFEGLRTAEILLQQPDWNLFEHGAPEGESIDDVTGRAQAVITRVRKDNCSTVLVAHGHMLRVVAACWLGMTAAEGRYFTLGTASLSILSYDHGRIDEPIVKLWNERVGAF